MADGFNPGDVVQLKSGGPLMTISSIEPFNGVQSATCRWFHKDNKQDKGVFALTMLVRDEEPTI